MSNEVTVVRYVLVHPELYVEYAMCKSDWDGR